MVSSNKVTPATTVLITALVAGQLLGMGCLPAFAQDTASDTTALKTDLPEGDLTVEDVTVEGNRLVPQEEILNVIKTRRGDKFDRDQVMRDLKAVNGMGYFDDRSLQAVPEMGGAGVLLKIRVQENAPVTQFAFQGNTVLSTEDLSHIFADQLGKPQNLTQLSQSIERIEQAYRDKGFVLARVTDVKDDPDGSVNVKIDEGSISSVQIVGNKKTKDFIIRNALKVKSGDVYNERQLTADLRKLFGNGYFNDIRRSLTPDPANPDKYQLKVEVDEKRTGSVGIGGGVDTIAGPFGNFSFSDSNFRGRGQILSFNSQLGTGMLNGTMNSINNGGMSFLPTGAQARSYQFEASFVEPNFRGGKTSVGVSGFARNYASMMVDEATQRTHGGSITLTRPLKGHWTGSLAFTGESTSLRGFGSMLTGGALDQLTRRGIGMGMDPQSAAVNAQNVRNTQLAGGLYASFKPTLYYDTRDSGFDPRKGTFAKITGGPSIGITGNSFGNLGVSVSKFVPVTKETTLAMNMQGGAAMGGVPQFAQYRLGGWNGVRGYDMFSALGTGTGLLMASAELRRRLPFIPKETKNPIGQYFNKNVKAVAFADLGGVSGNQLINNMYQRSTMAGSVGLGLRVNIPMLGLVRFDYGFPLLSSALGKLTPRFTIGFGDKF
jgi:outer membrane protein insertion porin family